jgi:hypothetical protein
MGKKVVLYSDQLFKSAAIEWLAVTDQVGYKNSIQYNLSSNC